MRLHEAGTVEAVVAQGGKSLTLFPSYLSDAPAALAEVVLTVMRSPGMDIATGSWQDEPGEWRWVLRREGNSVRIEVLRSADTFSRLPHERGERIFITDYTLLRLATQVQGQLHRLLNEYGEQGYSVRWRHPFPMAESLQLETAIQDRKHAWSRERR